MLVTIQVHKQRHGVQKLLGCQQADKWNHHLRIRTLYIDALASETCKTRGKEAGIVCQISLWMTTQHDQCDPGTKLILTHGVAHRIQKSSTQRTGTRC